MRETLGLTVAFGTIAVAGIVWILLDQTGFAAFIGLVVLVAGLLWARKLA